MQTVVPLCEAEVTVEFDYEKGEQETWNGLTGVGHPGSPPSLCVSGVWVGSSFVPREYFAEGWLGSTEQTILDSLLEEGGE